jgi:hypothetical protein
MTAINDDDAVADGAPRANAKRRYRPPALIEYGSISKLTHGTLTVQIDLLMGGMRMGMMQMMMCL